MNRNARIVLYTVAAVFAIAVIGAYYSNYSRGEQSASGASDEAAVRSQVTTFGAYLKSVPLNSATSSQLKEIIQSAYVQFVAPDLLTQWRLDPSKAPGRLVSSPWPDRIEILTVTKQGEGYIVTGNIIMQTSAGEAGKVPVVLQLVKQGGVWLIAGYQQASMTPIQQATSSTPAATGAKPKATSTHK